MYEQMIWHGWEAKSKTSSYLSFHLGRKKHHSGKTPEEYSYTCKRCKTESLHATWRGRYNNGDWFLWGVTFHGIGSDFVGFLRGKPYDSVEEGILGNHDFLTHSKTTYIQRRLIYSNGFLFFGGEIRYSEIGGSAYRIFRCMLSFKNPKIALKIKGKLMHWI